MSILHRKRSRYKPFYKQLIRLRQNVQNKKKILKFKRPKWEGLQTFYSRKLRFFRKSKIIDQMRYPLFRYANNHTKINKNFKNTLFSNRILRIFYGNLTKKQLKLIIKRIRKRKHIRLYELFVENLERRLDTILYRAKIVNTIVAANQLIRQGKVFVNDNHITSKSYTLKTGDMVSFDKKTIRLLLRKFFNKSYWPLPPKHLLINYRTMQILVLSFKKTHFLHNFHFPLNLHKVLNSYV